MNKRKRWSELSTRQRSSIMVAGVLQVLLAAAALLDLRRRPSDQVKGSKKLWAAAAFVNFVGPLAYFAFGRRPTNQTSLQGVDRHHGIPRPKRALN
jgi:bacteriorhodopsin